MKRAPIYSRSARKQHSGPESEPLARPDTGKQPSAPPTVEPKHADAPSAARRFPKARAFAARHERKLLVLSSVLLSALAFLVYSLALPEARRFTQRDIDAAVMHTLEKNVLPSPEAKAFERIRRSVVRVVQEGAESAPGKKDLRGVGSGVVIVDQGIILTNLHVVEGADKLKVQFANGFESEAIVLQRQPENDLAVIQAKEIPDDLVPATLRSTQGLAVGDKVVAVGFPFNIGPSASSGIVSGLKRNYHSPGDDEVLRNLIQFDAAANPGNSGGPLVTMDGEVVGIVTAILSPHQQGTFIGIGFAVPIEIAAAAAGESPF
ncbi:MAG TPA: trypsin-like peptidase domain-containing protein [Noviherbaspirillum sp.]